MPVVTVNWWTGISEQGRRQMIEEVTESVSRIAACPREAVTVIVRDVDPGHWGRGGITADLL